MASIEPRVRDGRKRYLVRYRDPSGKQKAKSFPRKIDAERWLVGVEHAKIAGTYMDPGRSKVPVGTWAREWLSGQSHLKATTRARYEGILSKHIEPRWGKTPLVSVDHAAVQKWVSDLAHAPVAPVEPVAPVTYRAVGLSGASVRYVHRVFSLIMELAVRDGRIPKNPATGVRLPKGATSEKRFLTPEEVYRLADACAQYPTPELGGQYRALILVLGFTGLRWGELAALRVKRVDLLRRRITVAESLTEVRGHLTWSTPKSHQVRSVPLPRFLIDLLTEVLAGKGSDDLVFTTMTGRPLRNLNWRRDVFDHAVEDVGLDGLTPHELRHTAASLAVSAGANVKAVQRMLGHASAAMTLDVYSGLFDADLDEVAVQLDNLPGVYPVCNGAEVIELPRSTK